jgi:prophage antirepressor-like protein
MSNIIKIGGVRGFIDENGVAQLNAEDVARGWGFTQIAKSGNEVVRWERVNKYLTEFGFVPTCGDGVAKDDFIPENMVYRLGFKASNETAQAFQAKLADEILPTIRKTGSYTAKPMSQLEIMAESIRILQEQDKRLKQIEQTQAEQSQELQGMRNVITLSSAEWRKETTQLLNKIAKNRGDGSYKDVRRESYTILNERMGVSVDVRLKNARARMYESGYSKTQIEKLNVLDVIDQDKKLVEGYMAIVKDMAIKYGVA